MGSTRQHGAPTTTPWVVGATFHYGNPNFWAGPVCPPWDAPAQSPLPAPCRMAATSTVVHKHGKTTVAPHVTHCLGNMFSLGACSAPCAAWRFAFRRQVPQTPAPKSWRWSCLGGILEAFLASFPFIFAF